MSAPGQGGGAAPAGRPRRRRGVIESLGSVILAFEVVIVGLGALVLFGLKVLPPVVALGGGAAMIVLMAITVATLRWRVGVWLGWAVQLIVIATGFLQPGLFFAGAIFTAIWTYAMVVGGRIARAQAAAAARDADS